MKEQLNELLNRYKKELDIYNKNNHFYVFLRTVFLILFILLIIAGMKIPAIRAYFMIIFFVLLVSFLLICIKHQRVKKEKEKREISLLVINDYYKRINNVWHDFKDTGENITTNNDILFDLDIIGKNSLFQYLNIAKSEGGRQRLLYRLSNHKLESLLEDQEVVSELANNLSFAVEFQVLCMKIKGNLTYEIQKLNLKTKSYKIVYMTHTLFTLTTLTLGLLSLFHVLPNTYFILSALLQLSYALIIDKTNSKEFNVIKSTSQSFANIYPVYKMMNNQEFSSKKMMTILESIRNGTRIIKSLNKIYDFDTFRNHFLGYIFANALFPLNSYLLYSLNKITTQSFDDLSFSINQFEDLESLISLSVLGVCKNNVCMPILTHSIELECEDIKHPLLKEDECISNNFKSKNDINIITGSNMSGKTSFMRTVAMNMILMNAGGFVNGKIFKAPYFKIFTSMRVNDDIEQGISTFYGELLRIKKIIDYKNSNEPFIVFIDEIFKGTNYNDRIYGAKEVIKRINVDHSIIFITTHDFELCDINNQKIKNYYFEEYYENNQIKFNYKIKEGKCKTTNARFLMKQLKIIE